jgi:hypothetical protein
VQILDYISFLPGLQVPGVRSRRNAPRTTLSLDHDIAIVALESLWVFHIQSGPQTLGQTPADDT